MGDRGGVRHPRHCSSLSILHLIIHLFPHPLLLSFIHAFVPSCIHSCMHAVIMMIFGLHSDLNRITVNTAVVQQ